MQYRYRVQLNTHMAFLASVYDVNNDAVYEVKAGDLLEADEKSLVEYGFMKSLEDVDGLYAYLVTSGVIDRTDVVTPFFLH